MATKLIKRDLSVNNCQMRKEYLRRGKNRTKVWIEKEKELIKCHRSPVRRHCSIKRRASSNQTRNDAASIRLHRARQSVGRRAPGRWRRR